MFGSLAFCWTHGASEQQQQQQQQQVRVFCGAPVIWQSVRVGGESYLTGEGLQWRRYQ